MVAIYRERDDIRAVSDFIVIYCGRGNFLGTTKSSRAQRKMSYFLLGNRKDLRSNYFCVLPIFCLRLPRLSKKPFYTVLIDYHTVRCRVILLQQWILRYFGNFEGFLGTFGIFEFWGILAVSKYFWLIWILSDFGQFWLIFLGTFLLFLLR